GGIVAFVRHPTASKEAVCKRVGSFEAIEKDQEVEVALQWNTGYYESLHSFANGIATIEGGMHEEGFKKALTNVVNKYARAKNLLKEKDDNLTGEDVREGLTANITVRRREAELFSVEGHPAAGSAISAREPRTQALLPIRGKILNVERARIDKMLKNLEVQSLIAAIGAGLDEEFDVEKIRYHKVILLADADVDGSHIRTLLLTFFFRQMKPMVEKGHVYIAQPPLYSTVVGKEKVYL